MLPEATETGMDAAVDAPPPLTVTEHQLSKFRTVSVTLPPPSPGPASAAAPSAPPSVGAPLSPLELPLDPLLDPLLDPPLELPLELPLDPLLELEPELLLAVASPGEASSPGVVAGVELLLHATAPATAKAAIPPIPSQSILLSVAIAKPPSARATCRGPSGYHGGSA
jgi:hypothetical protein